MKYLFYIVIITTIFGCDNGNQNQPKDTDNITGQYTATLTDAPNVPQYIGYDSPEKVIVNIEVIEKVMELADGVKYNFWTFGGRVPGKFIRVRENDVVELHLSNNPNNKMAHNIDLHAVTGPGGGAEGSMTAPGHTSQFSFKALHTGLYVYHCATAPVGMHIANGMYGLILVEPKEGLPPVDKEFYIMQSEFYTAGNFGNQGIQAFDMEKALKEQPEYVVFNGSVGANMGEKSLKVNVGETVRLFVGNAGPNLISSFHVIGEIFDSVHVEGGSLVNHNIQTTLIPAAGAAIIEFTCEVPGVFTIVDHSIFRAFNKGALAQIEVKGEENKDIYSHKQKDMIYPTEGNTAQDGNSSSEEKENLPVNLAIEDQIEKGKDLYILNCSPCHMREGTGLPDSYPPLYKSSFLTQRSDKGINILLHGLHQKISVNGKSFDGTMPQLQLSDDDIANILTFVHNKFCNDNIVVTQKEVTNKRLNK